jgi:NADPH2:quinone reductase
VLRLEQLPNPVPAGDQILVKLEAIGVNPVETYIRSGNYPRLPAVPYIPGSDGAGIEVATGQRVYLSGSLSGTYAEYCLARPDQVHPLPKRVSFQQGAALGVPYATAYQALFHKGNTRVGQRVLVRGASGAVGLAAVQLAKAHGCWVAGTASTEAGRKLAAQHGADQTCGHGETTGPYDVILETHANTGLQHDLEQCAPGGTIVIIGSRGPIEIDPRFTMSGDLTVRGMSLANATPEQHRAIHKGLAKGLRSGELQPVIAASYALEDAPEAHVAVLRPGATGKIVLLPAAR